MGPEVMRDESFRVSGPSKANLSPVRGGHYPVCGEPAWSSVSSKGRGKRNPLPRLSIFLSELGHLVSSAIGLGCIAHRPLDSHYVTLPNFLSHQLAAGGSWDVIASLMGRTNSVQCLGIYVSMCHLFMNLCITCLSSLCPFSHPPIPLSLRLFSENPYNTASQTQRVIVVSFCHSRILSIYLFFTYSYSQSAFRFSLMILTVVLFPLESFVKHGSYLVIYLRQGISLQLQIPLKLKLLSPSPGLSIACCAGRCAKILFSESDLTSSSPLSQILLTVKLLAQSTQWQSGTLGSIHSPGSRALFIAGGWGWGGSPMCNHLSSHGWKYSCQLTYPPWCIAWLWSI